MLKDMLFRRPSLLMYADEETTGRDVVNKYHSTENEA